MKDRFKIGDITVISAVLISAIILFLFMYIPVSDKATMLIVRNNDRETNYSLNKDKSIKIESRGYTLKIEITSGSVSVISSDCPDNTCVHTGSISQNGQIIACVPAGVTLTLSGEEADHDFIAG